MTKQELQKILVGVPDTAVVYVTSDHGQNPEQMGFVSVTSDLELPFYGDDINWVDVDTVNNDKITAVLLG